MWGGHREIVMGWRLPENHTPIYLVSGLRKVLQIPRAPLVAQLVKNPPAMQETWVRSLGQEDPLKDMTTLSNILSWRIPWMEELGGLQSIGLQRVGHD